jgi:hypothetical protein
MYSPHHPAVDCRSSEGDQAALRGSPFSGVARKADPKRSQKAEAIAIGGSPTSTVQQPHPKRTGHESPRTLARLPAAGRATKLHDRTNDAIRAETIVTDGLSLDERACPAPDPAFARPPASSPGRAEERSGPGGPGLLRAWRGFLSDLWRWSMCWGLLMRDVCDRMFGTYGTGSSRIRRSWDAIYHSVYIPLHG